MQYKHCHNDNFEDFASGRVILHKSGFPNFPVRLAQEIFCHCLSYLKIKTNICVYDPCCGSGYMLTVLGLLNFNLLETIVCSDCSNKALDATEQNLNLLTKSGINERINHLQTLYRQFNKTSHLQAIESAQTLLNCINEKHKINTVTFNANILSNNILTDKNFKADIVFTDIPYENMVSWQKEDEHDTNNLLENLLPVIKPSSIIAICSNKQQRIQSDKYIRLEKQQIGKRKFEIFTLSKER